MNDFPSIDDTPCLIVPKLRDPALESAYMNVQNPGSGEGSVPFIAFNNREQIRIRCYMALAVGDVVAIALSFLFANITYLGSVLAPHGTTILTVLLPIYLWAGAINGAYSGIVLAKRRASASKALRTLGFATASVLIIAYTFKIGAPFSRVVFWTGTVTSAILVLINRLVLGSILLQKLEGHPFSTVVIDDGGDLPIAAQNMRLDAREIAFDPRTDDPLHFDQLAKLVAHADRVVVSCSDDRVSAWSHVLKCMAVDGEIITPDIDQVGVIGVGDYEHRPTLIVSAGPLHLRDRTLKRAFDIGASLIALILLSPVLLAIAVAIRFETPGPILFRQQRIGRDNTLFMMLKFRSMYSDKSDATASVLTTRSDSRVTRVGNFIRRNSLDELPQLFNVLFGSMSMVGPRPHALSARAADQLYWEIDARYRHRHAVKPGVTGLAQIRGYRGATVFAADLTNRLASDLEYLSDWSMGKDMWILFRTIFVIRHDNAF